MLEVRYTKLIPCPYNVVLGQYYDYEHIEFVHPDTLGSYRLLRVEGDLLVYEHVWPGRGRRPASIVEHRFIPPNQMRFDFIEGRHRGTAVITKLEPRNNGCPCMPSQSDETLVDETYLIPGLPNWRVLIPLVRPFVIKAVERVWDEDLKVEVCHGGWPGVPESARADWTPEGAEHA